MPVCTDQQLCGDVGSSLRAVSSEGVVTVTWNTDKENAGLDHYELWRYAPSQGYGSAVKLADVEPQGSCDVNHNYGYQDSGAVNTDKYIVKVYTGSGLVCAPECAIELR